MLWQAIFEAQRSGVLPLTSACNLSCAFCSNKFNPPGVEVFRIPARSLDEIEASLKWLPSSGKIVIGESATRIIEGEPTTHPEFMNVVRLLRRKFPHRKIQITTNAVLLSQEMIAELSELGGINLVVSLNLRNKRARQLWLGDGTTGAVDALKWIQWHKLQFDGSVVALPHLTGWREVEESIHLLLDYGARTVRVMEPGFTRLTPSELQPKDPLELRARLQELARQASERWGRAVLVEPPQLSSLEAVVEGTLPGSPAELAGVRSGDVVVTVNGQPVLSRNHAFELCATAKRPVLKLRRGPISLEVTLEKNEDQESGLVLYDDVPYADLTTLARYVERYKEVVIVTSTAAQECVVEMVRVSTAMASKSPTDVRVLTASNRFFGGSIRCAGLLTVCDIMEELEERHNSSGRVALILPRRAFDSRGRDITGRSYTELWRKTGFETILI